MLSHVSILLLLLPVTSAQLGCDMLACDARGTFCQADFQIANNSRIMQRWTLPIGPLLSNRALGCVGNDANVICPVQGLLVSNRGYVAINSTSGKKLWYDSILRDPQLPIMNLQGDIIATDGKVMEMRLANGSIVGSPEHFYGDGLEPISSIMYVEDPDLFYFTSYKIGQHLLYDTSGMCVASYFLNDDQRSNYTEVWMPLTKPVINTEADTRRAYFIIRSNLTGEIRLTALNFNHEPPYLQQKWTVSLPGLTAELAAETILLTRDNLIFVGTKDWKTSIYQDKGSSVDLITDLTFGAELMSTFRLPLGQSTRDTEDEMFADVVWMAGNVVGRYGKIFGYSIKEKATPYIYDMVELFDGEGTITSQIMVFGTRASTQTLVFGVSLLTNENPGHYLVAVRPGKQSATLVWSVKVDDLAGVQVQGQIIGVRDDIIVAYAGNSTTGQVLGFTITSPQYFL